MDEEALEERERLVLTLAPAQSQSGENMRQMKLHIISDQDFEVS